MAPTPPQTTSASNLAQYAQVRNTTLLSWIRGLSSDKFGDTPEQHAMLENYRNLSLNGWPYISAKYWTSQNLVLEHEISVNYGELGRAMLWMVKNPRYDWLKDLFKATLNFSIEMALKTQGSIMA